MKMELNRIERHLLLAGCAASVAKVQSLSNRATRPDLQARVTELRLLLAGTAFDPEMTKAFRTEENLLEGLLNMADKLVQAESVTESVK